MKRQIVLSPQFCGTIDARLIKASAHSGEQTSPTIYSRQDRRTGCQRQTVPENRKSNVVFRQNLLLAGRLDKPCLYVYAMRKRSVDITLSAQPFVVVLWLPRYDSTGCIE